MEPGASQPDGKASGTDLPSANPAPTTDISPVAPHPRDTRASPAAFAPKRAKREKQAGAAEDDDDREEAAPATSTYVDPQDHVAFHRSNGADLSLYCAGAECAGLRYVDPYPFTFRTHAKGRWYDRQLIEVCAGMPGNGRVMDGRCSAPSSPHTIESTTFDRP